MFRSRCTLVRRLSGFEEGAKVILLDGSNGVHLANLTSDTLDLDTDVSAPLNDLICVVGELWWRRITVELDVAGNHSFRNKNIQRPHINKEAIANHTAHHTITDLTLERSPNHRLEHDGELRKSRARQNARFGDIQHGHHTDDVEVSGVCAFDVLVECVGDVFVCVFVEVGGVEVYHSFHFVEEEHGGWWVERCVCA